MACACGNGQCQCGSMTNVIYLEDEAGVAHAFFLGEQFVVQGRIYQFAASAENNEQFALLRVNYDEQGHEIYTNITDDREWDEIEAALQPQ